MLRLRTGYSFRQASGHLEECLGRLKEIGATHAPITDRASTFGWARWAKATKKHDLTPVFGVELGVSPSINAKPRPSVDNWLFIARDSITPINKLVALATQQFRFAPVITVEQALAAAAECNVIVGHRPQLDWEVPPPEGAFMGVSPASSKGLINRAISAGWRLAATGDNRYPREGDGGWYEVLVGRNAESQTYPQHILSPDEWRATVPWLDGVLAFDAAENSNAILRSSTAKLIKAKLPVPRKPATLRQMCEAGGAALNCDLSDPIYAARLDRELKLIADKGYEDYFYIVSDLCQWARGKMIVGPARGSSCGSLACYLLRITTIDPIPHGLIFERFIDINRDDMPDIDIDFSDQQRHLVFEYMIELYGADRVARLGTVAMFKPRSALQEISAALRIPRFKCDAVADSLIERSSGDSRALNTLEDTLQEMPAGKILLRDHPEVRIVTRFEGHPRHYSQHAAGVVVASEPIVNYVAVDHRTGATMCDKKDAEEAYELLKIDALGLTQLSVFEDALELVGLPRNHLETLPLEDEAAFGVLNDAKFAGIFQFNGLALQSIVKQFKVGAFDDIVSITALGRPGPLASGGAHEWVRRRNGVHAVSYPHPLFEPYLRDTLGIVLYQEQVMEIGRNIGDMDWGQVTALRKAMSKSLGKEYFDQFGDPWKKAAIAKGVAPADAEKVWDDLCAYGAWSFNKSHSVAYGVISYWCCWLKAHHPFEFAAATLSHEKDPAAQIQLLREMVAEGYQYVPIDAGLSEEKWKVGKRGKEKVLIGPLSNVVGIGPKYLQSILSCRRREEKVPDRLQKMMIGAKTPIDSLWPIRDAFAALLPDPQERNIYTPPTPIVKLTKEQRDYEAVVFCTLTKINPRNENEAVNVARRGGKIIPDDDPEGLLSLNLTLADDTGTIFGKIRRKDYERLGRPLVELGRTGRALYAIKGKMLGHRGTGDTFRMLMISGVKLIGDMDDLKPVKVKPAPKKRAKKEAA